MPVICSWQASSSWTLKNCPSPPNSCPASPMSGPILCVNFSGLKDTQVAGKPLKCMSFKDACKGHQRWSQQLELLENRTNRPRKREFALLGTAFLGSPHHAWTEATLLAVCRQQIMVFPASTAV